MLKLFFLKAWPALIPVAIYLIWLAIRRRKARRAGDTLPTLLSGPWITTLGVSLAVLAACLFYAGLSAEQNAGVSYQPKRFEDGKLIGETLE